MMTDEAIEELTKAAELIYQYCDKQSGFESGITQDPETHRRIKVWNSYSGAKKVLENKLKRDLSNAEITILSLAVGFGPTPCLTKSMRDEAMNTCWQRHNERQIAGAYIPMMHVLTSFY